MRIRRVAALTLALLAAACAAEVAAPRSLEPSPSAPPTALARPAVPDAIYVRQSGKGAPTYITLIDMTTGTVHGALPDGIVSPDRSTLYRIESMDGATRTRVHEIDVATGDERRAFTLDGDWIMPQSMNGPIGVSADGRSLVLSRRGVKLDGSWVSGFAVLDVTTGRVRASTEFRASSITAVAALAPHGDAVVVTQAGDGQTRVRVWDVTSRDFLTPPPSAVDRLGAGFIAAPLSSRDGSRLYLLDAGNASTAPFISAIDFATRSAARIELPAAQSSADFQKYLLWSLGLSPDGATLYAIDPALGSVDEIDTHALVLRRSRQFAVTSAGPKGLAAAVSRLMLPLAEAKRYIRGGALVSPDGRTLYAAGTTGIAVIDANTLHLREVWAKDSAFDDLVLTPDGARLYGIDDRTSNIEVLRSSDGSVLGAFRPEQYASNIVRIDGANAARTLAPAAPAPCGAYAPPDPSVPAEIQHLKTTATVVDVTSACTLRVRVAGGAGTLERFTGKSIILRATSGTRFASASQGDLEAIGAMKLKPGDAFTLAFDSRAFADGSYPINSMGH